jgi:hypothetical protein
MAFSSVMATPMWAWAVVIGEGKRVASEPAVVEAARSAALRTLDASCCLHDDIRYINYLTG